MLMQEFLDLVRSEPHHSHSRVPSVPPGLRQIHQKAMRELDVFCFLVFAPYTLGVGNENGDWMVEGARWCGNDAGSVKIMRKGGGETSGHGHELGL